MPRVSSTSTYMIDRRERERERQREREREMMMMMLLLMMLTLPSLCILVHSHSPCLSPDSTPYYPRILDPVKKKLASQRRQESTHDYITVFTMRQWDVMYDGTQKKKDMRYHALCDQIFVHSKIMIVDDR
eukprot:TRINITY_DN1995_c1_g2_i1.p2 TRINITY_DN1995_c1_g2~~TRINITY_DN1995_c1_g2_i1.p2  ORF type:complete len:130 (+),score=14.65 TRINITY_DN1995_c1_g2_i1:231-620(+)